MIIFFNLNILRSKILTVSSCSSIFKVRVVPSLPPPPSPLPHPPPRYQTFLEKCKKMKRGKGYRSGGGGVFINLICYLIRSIYNCEAPFLKIETLIYDTGFVERNSSFIIVFIFAKFVYSYSLYRQFTILC